MHIFTLNPSINAVHTLLCPEQQRSQDRTAVGQSAGIERRCGRLQRLQRAIHQTDASPPATRQARPWQLAAALAAGSCWWAREAGRSMQLVDRFFRTM